MVETENPLINKRVIVFHFLKENEKPYFYRGILISIKDNSITINDEKEGIVILPLEKCKIREIADGS